MHRMSGTTVLAYGGTAPQVDESVLLAAGARLIGNVRVAADASIWFNAVLRADEHSISIGAATNVQDNCSIHVTAPDHPAVIGSRVTIGHGAVLHGCTVADHCLIGMGAILLDGCAVEEHTMVAAGALVPPGKRYPAGSLLMGAPARVARPLTEAEIQSIRAAAEHYIEIARSYLR